MGRKITAQELYDCLKEDFNFSGAEGFIKFNLRDYYITVEQNNVVGNIIEEWLSKWMKEQDFSFIHNEKQAAPDFWLDPDNLNSAWLEIKSFYRGPGFDVSAFLSYINEIIEHPWKLHSNYLLIKYRMDDGGMVTIEDFWLKNVWEICSTSSSWPLKVQYKNKSIVNIRPCTWYSERTDFKPFECLEDFLAALEETIYKYPPTRATLAKDWADRLKKSYKKHYGVNLNLPRWNDVSHKYIID